MSATNGRPGAPPRPSSGLFGPIAPIRVTRRSLVLGASGALGLAALGRLPASAPRVVRAAPAAQDDAFVPPSFSDEEIDRVIDELADAGVAVYASAAAPDPIVEVADPGPMALLLSQVRAMVAEACNGGGFLGADLDDLVAENGVRVEDEEYPSIPPSPFIAGYVSAVESPGAVASRRFMPLPGMKSTENAIFPSLVLAFFAAEIARDNLKAAEEAGYAVPDSTRLAAGPGALRALPAAQAGACSAVQGFIDNVLNAIFDALQVDLGNSLPGRILGSILDFVREKAKAAVREAVRTLLAPVLNVIKTIAGVIGTVSMVVSVLRPWSITMTPDPTATRLAVGAEPPLPGSVSCRVDLGGFDEWPADVADCAAQSGTPLPPLKPAGAECRWTIEQSRGAPLIVPTDQPAKLDSAAGATFAYVTTSEDERTARGKAINGWVRVTLNITRPAISDLQKTLTNLAFSQLPGIVQSVIQPILGPVVSNLLSKLTALVDNRATAVVAVTYHEPKEEEPTPEPEEADAASVSVAFEPVGGASFPLGFYLDATTCDGDEWNGTLRFQFVFEAMHLDETLPVAWDFGGGDATTTTVGPFEAPLAFPDGTSYPFVATIELGVTRLSGGKELSFTLDATISFFGVTETSGATNYTNYDTPVPVTPLDAC